MKSLRKIIDVLRNKYVLTTIAFLIWMIFFDDNSLINQLRLNKALAKVEKEKQFYISEIEKDKETAYNLISDEDNLERFAREKYLMKKKDEDVYILIETDEEGQKRLEKK